MKKTLLLLALFAGSLLSANADDVLKAFVKPGETKQLAVQLKNDVDYTAFQMKITLPEGMSFPTGAEAVLAKRADASHQIASKVDGQSMIVVVYSYDATAVDGNKAFKNDKGSALFLVDVNVTGSFKDQACDVSGVKIENIEFVKETNLTKTLFANVTSASKLGNVNGDGLLDTVDATLVLWKTLNSVPNGNTFDEDAADVNCDGVLDTVDATEILWETLR